MHFRSHLFASILTGLALYRRSPARTGLVVLSGVLIDVDHYLLYASRSGDWNPLGALRYNERRAHRPRRGDTRPRYGPLRSIAHHAPLTLPLLWGLAHLFPALRPCAIGVTLHLAMDAPWRTLLDYRVWLRSGGRCERCNECRGGLRVYHIVSPRRGGDFWPLENRVLWCERCVKTVRRAQGDM